MNRHDLYSQIDNSGKISIEWNRIVETEVGEADEYEIFLTSDDSLIATFNVDWDETGEEMINQMDIWENGEWNPDVTFSTFITYLNETAFAL